MSKHGLDELSKKSGAFRGQRPSNCLKSSKADEPSADGIAAIFLPALHRFLRRLLKARAEQDRLGTIENAVLEARKLMQKGDVKARGLKAKDLLQANPTSAPVQSFLKDVESSERNKQRTPSKRPLKTPRHCCLARQAQRRA